MSGADAPQSCEQIGVCIGRSQRNLAALLVVVQDTERIDTVALV